MSGEPDSPSGVGRVYAQLKARWKPIPYIGQMSASDCGLACVAMVLGYYGKHLRLEDARREVPLDNDGVSAYAVIEMGRLFGLRGRGVSVDADEFEVLPPGSILHWEFKHFVVLERMHRNHATVLDPGRGRLKIPLERFRKSFTGVAILFEPNDDFQPAKSGDSRVWRYLRQVLASRQIWIRVLVTSVLIQAVSLTPPAIFGVLIDRAIPTGDRSLVLTMIAGLGTILAFYLVGTLVRSHLLIQLRAFLDARMTMGFLEQLMELPYSFFQQRSSGDLLSRLNSKTVIVNTLTAATLSTLLDGTLVTLYLIALVWMSPTLVLWVVLLALLQVLVFASTAKRQRALALEDVEILARCSTGVLEMLQGIETLKSMGAERRALEDWSGQFSGALDSAVKYDSLEAKASAIAATLRLGSPLLILCLGAFQVINGQLSLGEMLAFNTLAMGFLAPVASLVHSAAKLQLVGGHVERLDDIYNHPRESAKPQNRRPRSFEGAIEVEKVSFRYGPLTPMVLENISLEVEPGQFVALVGRSGSGKSTLASLMLGLQQPTAGRVLFDGEDLTELNLISVRQQVGVVTQRAFLFRTTVLKNITLGDPSISREQVISACRQACIHDEISELPLGYDSLLTEGGASLSGGQGQRITLARALARRPKILLLDEATSALDSVTEAAVQAQLGALHCTRVVVAHRLSTVAGADRILVMANGRVVEAGTHAELLARQSAYAELLSGQLRAG